MEGDVVDAGAAFVGALDGLGTEGVAREGGRDGVGTPDLDTFEAFDAATKWGMNGWSESLRQQLHPGVRVIVIEPGAVATELTEHITHGETKSAVEQMYEATSIAPEDIADIIAFAVSRPRSVSLNEILVRPTGQAL